MPTHHVPDSMLIAYAAGSLGAAESLLVACHITLCPACRRAVAHAELVGAALLDGLMLPGVRPGALPPGVPIAQPGAQPGVDLLDRILARLDHEPAGHAPAEPARASRPGPAAGERSRTDGMDPARVLPAPLYRLVGGLDAMSWHEVLPGLALVDVAVPGGQGRKRSSLVRLAPGARVPRHDHAGSEYLVVLAGGYRDDRGQYARGDVSARSAGEIHEQRADPGEPCIWLVVSDDLPILLPDAAP